MAPVLYVIPKYCLEKNSLKYKESKSDILHKYGIQLGGSNLKYKFRWSCYTVVQLSVLHIRHGFIFDFVFSSIHFFPSSNYKIPISGYDPKCPPRMICCIHCFVWDLGLRLSECKFAQKQIKLGQIQGNGTRQLDPEKVWTVMEIKSPTTKQEIQQFIGIL